MPTTTPSDPWPVPERTPSATGATTMVGGTPPAPPPGEPLPANRAMIAKGSTVALAVAARRTSDHTLTSHHAQTAPATATTTTNPATTTIQQQPRTIAVPDVTGSELQAAVARLTAAGVLVSI